MWLPLVNGHRVEVTGTSSYHEFTARDVNRVASFRQDSFFTSNAGQPAATESYRAPDRNMYKSAT